MRPPKTCEYDFFLAGVMQGSHTGKDLHPQEYRERIKALIGRKAPGARVFDPLDEHSGSVEYSDQKGLAVFQHHLDLAEKCGVLLCYLPVASMGTAIEMYECHRKGIAVITISPMATNWIVRFFSHRVFPDLDSFEEWLSPSSLAALHPEIGA